MRWVAAAVVALWLAVPAGAQTVLPAGEGELVGHYYLSGVREVGSELLLEADGTFKWMLAYGSEDLATDGTWVRMDDQVILKTAARKAGPLITLGPRAEWNDDAASALRDSRRRSREAALSARCPFLNMSAEATTTTPVIPPMVGGEGKKRGSEAKAAARLAEARRARRAVEVAMARAMRAGRGPEVSRAAVSSTADRWNDARWRAVQAYTDAGLGAPDLAPPRLPPGCVMPDDPPASAQRREDPRLAVVVGDAKKGRRLTGVRVAFHYADGPVIEGVSDRGGWVFAPARTGTAVRRLTVAAPVPGQDPVSLDMPAFSGGVQAIDVDTALLIPPPFETMVLKLDGGDLRAPFESAGRYSRH